MLATTYETMFIRRSDQKIVQNARIVTPPPFHYFKAHSEDILPQTRHIINVNMFNLVEKGVVKW